jgi:hypothetical protein
MARGCNWPHHGLMGGGGGVGARAHGGGRQRHPRRLGERWEGRGAGQLASTLATLGAGEASRAAGWRRTRAEGASTERRRAWRGGARGGARMARGGFK